MEKNFQFELVTPERVVLREQLTSLTLPTVNGEITILPGHVPLVSVLKPGVMIALQVKGEQRVIAVSGGFVEVLEFKVVVLADTAEMASELDEERIKVAQAKAEFLKQSAANHDDLNFADVSALLDKELARLSAVKYWRRLKK
ncbi:ATP synthase F1 subunit epsilon [Candidatus Falkowbacteria bacterium CG10_big_fil_rev_8_21_14_0_10_37_14]|uniref:ATP synthase epsilon chain n=1 Tax=Candidatus Falkowbacteria bacterium CG10_big_fil_rev_8_21_14_0_10_37_14 TaxID=1974561 RepID=A0A2M6WU98_9BACT|nr:ATP synthase F1 subunit epsilon [Candidatus Falkowbacteria bacterium]PIT96359.1 MAG: ATP synthase F1 subunit epsilon [Candidatus Falkowbacteria bacterium CG10_big_fil_rev_8_21_14_0_10_37_14]